MNQSNAYHQLLSDIVEALVDSTGAGYALRALGLEHPLAPPGDVTDYDGRVRLSAYLEGSRSHSAAHLREIAIRDADNAAKFLEDRRRMQLRQARITFDAAITLVLIGTAVVLVALLFSMRILQRPALSAHLVE